MYYLHLLLVLHGLTCVRQARAAMRVFGGRDARPGEFPYVVRMEAQFPERNTSKSICTGVVLTPIVTLTAAHCIVEYEMAAAKVTHEITPVLRHGSPSGEPTNSDSYSKIFGYVLHPGVDATYCLNVLNDIVLLRNAPITLDRYGKVSAVDYAALAGHAAVAAGYGRTFTGDRLTNTLMARKPLQILDVVVKLCPTNMLESSCIRDPKLCVSRRCGHSIAAMCTGDSGGPIIHPSGVVGIVSTGEARDCSLRQVTKKQNSNAIAVFTAISPFVQWISDVINN